MLRAVCSVHAYPDGAVRQLRTATEGLDRARLQQQQTCSYLQLQAQLVEQTNCEIYFTTHNCMSYQLTTTACMPFICQLPACCFSCLLLVLCAAFA